MTELTDRMRTCAAALVDKWITAMSRDELLRLQRDAAALLTEAADLLDTPDPLGEPMERLRQVSEAQTNIATWTGVDLPPAEPRRCPSCGAVSARTVKRIARSRTVALLCPVCSHQWELA